VERRPGGLPDGDVGSSEVPPDNPVGFPPVRRGEIFQLTLLALVAAAITTAVAILIPWLPEHASDEAVRINFTYWFMTVIAIVVFAVVAAVLVYAIWKFRVPADDLSDGPPIHGHTGLEIAWTAIPFLLVTAVAVVSAIVLHDNSQAKGDPLRVTVIGQQFAWTFQYKKDGPLFPTLKVPEGRSVVLTITSKDVLHSFWVPQMFQKQDAVPGLPTELVITPNRTGTFPVICVELCGLGHSTMRSQMEVMDPAAFAAWYKTAGSVASPAAAAAASASAASANAAAGQTAEQSAIATFNGSGCNACHTLSAAHATGTVGPNLDTALKADAAKAGQPLMAFVEQSITDPQAYIAAGYTGGIMPTTFKTSIPPDKLNELVQYLTENAK
jgi:cytochrome c oxidase subunit 2